MKRLAIFRGFAVDLALAGVAGIFGFHPVWNYLHAHPAVVYWGCGSLHLLLIPLFFSQLLGGHGKSGDLLSDKGAHSTAYVWSSVGVMGTSFLVPFVCSLVMRVEVNLPFSLIVLFAPLFAFIGPGMLAVVFPKLATRDVKIPDLLGPALPSTIVTLLTTAYLALQESTMFLANESKQPSAGGIVAAGFALGYVPVRLFLFYATAKDRREIYSVIASFAFVAFQLTSR